jgi:hypothetical protein
MCCYTSLWHRRVLSPEWTCNGDTQGDSCCALSISTPKQTQFSGYACLTFLRRCAIAVSAFLDVFRNVAQFVTASGNDCDAMGTALVSLIDGNRHVFPFLSPFLFGLLTNPLDLGAIPTRAGVDTGRRLHLLIRGRRRADSATADHGNC